MSTSILGNIFKEPVSYFGFLSLSHYNRGWKPFFSGELYFAAYLGILATKKNFSFLYSGGIL